MSDKKANYIYIMVNEGFDEIKIGHSKNLKSRKGTFNTATPKPYHIYAIYETDGLKDKKVHNIIKNLNPTLHYNNEFFNMTPEQAYLLFKNIAAINGLENNLHYNPHEDDYITKTYGKNPPKEKRQPKQTMASAEDEKNMFYIKSMPSVTCLVKQMDNDKFEITLPKGTKIKEKDFGKSELTDAEQLVKDIREKHQDCFDDTTYITTKDIVFDAPAQPVKFALGSNQNGRDYLINKETGLSFAECYPK